LGFEQKEADMTEWNQLVQKVRNLSKTISVGLVGKYVELPDAYLSLVEAMKHAGFTYDTDIEIDWIDSEALTGDAMVEALKGLDAIVVPVVLVSEALMVKLMPFSMHVKTMYHF